VLALVSASACSRASTPPTCPEPSEPAIAELDTPIEISSDQDQRVRARWLAASQAPARPIHAALTLALTAARQVGLPHSEAEAHRFLATLIPCPEDDRREHLAAARTLFTRLGAAWDLAHLDER